MKIYCMYIYILCTYQNRYITPRLSWQDLGLSPEVSKELKILLQLHFAFTATAVYKCTLAELTTESEITKIATKQDNIRPESRIWIMNCRQCCSTM